MEPLGDDDGPDVRAAICVSTPTATASSHATKISAPFFVNFIVIVVICQLSIVDDDDHDVEKPATTTKLWPAAAEEAACTGATLLR